MVEISIKNFGRIIAFAGGLSLVWSRIWGAFSAVIVPPGILWETNTSINLPALPWVASVLALIGEFIKDLVKVDAITTSLKLVGEGISRAFSTFVVPFH